MDAGRQHVWGARRGLRLHHIAEGAAVITIVLAATLICVSTIIVAYAIWRARRKGEESTAASAIGSALRFVSGPKRVNARGGT